jgi:anti-sigma factor RsiW
MKCEEVRELLEALHDNELVPETRAAVVEHVQVCPDCARALRGLEVLRPAIARAGRFAAPAELRARIVRTLRHRDAAFARGWRWRTLSALAASHAAALIGGGLVVYMATSGYLRHGFATQEVVAAHVRSLLDERRLALTSGDQHTVRPWFAGKLDFSPEVVNLEQDGFPLLGARVDYVDGRYKAALEYTRRNHKITVFEAPADETLVHATTRSAHNGYNVIQWVSGSLSYQAISDLNGSELGHFATLMRRKTRE